MRNKLKKIALLSSISTAIATAVPLSFALNHTNVAKNNLRQIDFNFKNANLKSQTIIPNKKVIDVFGTKLQQYSAYDIYWNKELGLNLLLDQFVQFSDVDFKGPDVLLVTDQSKEEFINQSKPSVQAIINDSKEMPTLGTSLTFYINYNPVYDIHNNIVSYVNKTNEITITNLKPLIEFSLNTSTYNIKYNDAFAYYKADEFANNFQTNILGDANLTKKRLINYNSQNSIRALINTNIPYGSFLKFRPVITLGHVDKFNGTILNNSIEIQVPSINRINPQWSYSEDEFQAVRLNFDLVNFQKEELRLNLNQNTFFNVSTNPTLSNIKASSFDEELFLNQLIQTEVFSSNPNYLVTINANIDKFKSIYSNFRITNVNDQKGELFLSFTINQKETITYNLSGFKKVTSISQPKKEIQKTDYGFLNNQSLQDNFTKSEPGYVLNYIKDNINSFFGTSNSIFNVSDENFATNYIDAQKTTIQLWKNLGKIKITFTLQTNISNLVYFNDQIIVPGRTFELIVGGFNKNKFYVKLVSTSKVISDKDALSTFDSFSTFYDSFVTNVNDSPSRYKVIETNLTKEELQYQIISFDIDKSIPYNVALISITYLDNSNSVKTIQVGINNSSNIGYSAINTNLNASKIDFLKNKSVDDITQEDIINLVGFNNQPTKYNFLTVNASKEVFKNVLLNKCNISRKNTSVNVNLELATSPTQSTKINLSIGELKPKIKPYSEILFYVFLGALGFILLNILAFILVRARNKKYALKHNKWDKGGK